MDYAIYSKSDNLLVLVCQSQSATGVTNFDGTATVRVDKVTDESGATITGQAWPLVLAYSAAITGETEPTGRFVATLPYTLDVTAGKRYVLHGYADGGPGRRREFKVRLLVTEQLIA